MKNYKGGFGNFLIQINDKLVNNGNSPYLGWIVRVGFLDIIWNYHSVHSTYGLYIYNIYIMEVELKELEGVSSISTQANSIIFVPSELRRVPSN